MDDDVLSYKSFENKKTKMVRTSCESYHIKFEADLVLPIVHFLRQRLSSYLTIQAQRSVNSDHSN